MRMGEQRVGWCTPQSRERRGVALDGVRSNLLLLLLLLPLLLLLLLPLLLLLLLPLLLLLLLMLLPVGCCQCAAAVPLALPSYVSPADRG